MKKKNVLFVCVHNSARSQMAEAFLNSIGADKFRAESAGLEPGVLNPLVVEVMKDAGIDISGNDTTSVDEMLGKDFDYVITVCDEANAQRCPVFPGGGKKLHWGFPDPSVLKGTRDEQLVEIKCIRDQIKNKIEVWLKDV